MTHYRRTSATCQALVRQAEALRDGTDEGEERFEQFMAFALGWIVHVGTDTIAHSFVNEQCGGPYRDHPTRHHLIENHIDAWNYAQSGAGGTIPARHLGKDRRLSGAVLVRALVRGPAHPGRPRRQAAPVPLSDDPDERKEQLDVDGELPGWLTEGIVKALIETFADHPHPKIYQGGAFQQAIDAGKLTTVGQGRHRARSRPALPGTARRDRAATAVRSAAGLPAALGGRHGVPTDDHAVQAQLQRRVGAAETAGAGLHHRPAAGRLHEPLPAAGLLGRGRRQPGRGRLRRARSRSSNGSSRRSPPP